VGNVLDRLEEAGVVDCYRGGVEPVWSIAQGRHHVAAFYRNGALHHFVNRAIIELALLRVAADGGAGGEPLDVAWEDALRLRDLLKFEFFFAEKALFREELRDELDRLDPSWADKVQSADAATDVLLDSQMLVAHRALRTFLDAQWIVATQLAAMDPRTGIDRNAFLDACQGIGRQHVLQGHVHGPESVSRELFASAMKLAANRDILDPGREDVREGRRAWVAELEEVVSRLRTIDGLDQRVLEGVLAS
jgi:glycerol-3-phosphate O-acyltransferase